MKLISFNIAHPPFRRPRIGSTGLRPSQEKHALAVRRPDRKCNGSEIRPDLPRGAPLGWHDKYLVGSIRLAYQAGGPDPISDPPSIGGIARPAAFGGNAAGVSSFRGNQIDTSAVTLRAERDGFAVGRKRRLVVVGRIAGELPRLAALGGLNPNLEIALAVAVRGV